MQITNYDIIVKIVEITRKIPPSGTIKKQTYKDTVINDSKILTWIWDKMRL